MVKSLFRFSSSFVQKFGIRNTCSPSVLRVLHTDKFHDSIDEEEKREQFNGPIPVECLKIRYSRSPGPGGQNVNKVNTKVDIRFHVMSAQWIPYWIRKKFVQEEGNRVNKDGEMVVQSSRFRNQQKNLIDGIQKVQKVLENVSMIPKETSQEKKAKISELMKADDERRLKEKKFRSLKKRDRSRNL